MLIAAFCQGMYTQFTWKSIMGIAFRYQRTDSGLKSQMAFFRKALKNLLTLQDSYSVK